MAEPHTSSHPSHAHGNADQPALANGQASGGPSAAGEGRITSLSSQLQGLTAEVAKNAPSGEIAKEAAQEPEGGTVDIGREEDWGIAPPRSSMARETKIGFAFVLMLLVVFGFVVYKKVEQNKLENGDLLASVNENDPVSPTPETPPGPTPKEDESLPPIQNADPFANENHLPEVTPTSFENQNFENQTFAPDPTQVAASNPPEPSTSIDAFPPVGGGSHDGAGGPTPVEPFPQEFQDTPTPVAQNEPQEFAPVPAADPQEFSPVPFPANQQEIPANAQQEPVPFPADQNQFAQVDPAGQGFEPPQPIENSPAEAEVVIEPTPENSNGFEPFPGTGSSESAATTDINNEQFSAQSEPVPVPVDAAPAGNPFGDVASKPATTPEPTGGDPFAVTTVESGSTNATETFAPAVPAGEPLPVPETSSAPPQELATSDDWATQNPAASPVPSGNLNQEPCPIPQELPGSSPTPVPGESFAGSPSSAPELLTVGDEVGVYVVRPGDNYWKISKSQYGTVRYFSALARYNEQRIPDPKKMRPGMKVLIPTRQSLEAQNPDLFPRFTATEHNVSSVGHQANQPAGFFLSAQGEPMYRVGQNDTLGGIAHKHLGRFSRWQEIYRLNRHRLKNPNALTLGDVLQLPPDASRVSMVRHASGIR